MIGKVQDVMSAVLISATDSVAKSVNSDSTSSTTGNNAAAPGVQPGAADAASQAVVTQKADSDTDQQKDSKQKDDKQKMDEKSVNNMTKELNKLMSQINCNLEFQYHKEVNMMSVKMIDKNTNEVLKEYPPEDMIKGMIKAKEWIGAFLDKNA